MNVLAELLSSSAPMSESFVNYDLLNYVLQLLLFRGLFIAQVRNLNVQLRELVFLRIKLFGISHKQRFLFGASLQCFHVLANARLILVDRVEFVATALNR